MNMSSTTMECPKLSEEQIKVLEDSFKGCKHPDETELMLVAAECGLSEADTKVSGNLISACSLCVSRKMFLTYL